MPIVFVLSPVGGAASGSRRESSQWRGQSFRGEPIGAEGCRDRGRATGERDALIGGAGLLFTYRSRWPLFTFYWHGACWGRLAAEITFLPQFCANGSDRALVLNPIKSIGRYCPHGEILSWAKVWQQQQQNLKSTLCHNPQQKRAQ